MNGTASTRGLTQTVGILVLLASLASLIYSNTFFSSFQFDDGRNIVNNNRIRQISTAVADISESRYVGYLSFAINYAFGGLNVAWYHVTNLLIHVTNGFLVYVLIVLLGCTPRNGIHPPKRARPASWFGLDQTQSVALLTAILFVTHPIQTQAVTYIVQRFASLATLFYLLAIVCYLKWRLIAPVQRRRYAWYLGALVSTTLGMKTKEISFTIPFMLILVEWIFFQPTTWKAWRPIVPFLFTLAIIPSSLSEDADLPDTGFIRETDDISRLSYLVTQFRVIATYIRLLLLPIHQNVDYAFPIYGWPLAAPAVLSLLALLSLFGLAIYLMVYHPGFRLLGFGLVWFFLTLSIESSIIPIRDVIFEHRLYLPSIGFFLAVSAVALNRRDRFTPASAFVVAAVIMAFSVATFQRNAVWKDESTLWSDVLAKNSRSVRAHINLGLVYLAQDRVDEATIEFTAALRLNPNASKARASLGYTYLRQNRLDEAIVELMKTLELSPDSPSTHDYLALAYVQQGRWSEASSEYATVVKLRPEFPQAHYNLGNAYMLQGRWDDARAELIAALRLGLDIPEIHFRLGGIHARQQQITEAVQEYRAALQLQPDFAPAVEALHALGISS